MISCPKIKTFRSKQYLNWLAKQPSLIPGTGDVIYHHVKMFGHGGTSKKPPDNECIPIHDSVHNHIGQYGEKRVLCLRYGYSQDELARICDGYYQEWLKEKAPRTGA